MKTYHPNERRHSMSTHDSLRRMAIVIGIAFAALLALIVYIFVSVA